MLILGGREVLITVRNGVTWGWYAATSIRGTETGRYLGVERKQKQLR